ncbi:hypothetical protein J6590_075195 [Homalodisca vitripennis]|nr:hypothetical protein J6590_075195 [Homalodisca vitripennis]
MGSSSNSSDEDEAENEHERTSERRKMFQTDVRIWSDVATGESETVFPEWKRHLLKVITKLGCPN